jgi:hypothetical protein
MWNLVSGFLSDPKKSAPLYGLVTSALVEVAGARGWALDVHTADQITLVIMGMVATVVASHAHTEAAQIRADGQTDSAQTAADAKAAPQPSKN